MFTPFMLVVMAPTGLFVALWLVGQATRWVVVPIRIHGKSFAAISPDYAAVSADALTPAERDSFDRAAAGFAREGFAAPALFKLVGAVDTGEAVQLRMTHPTTGDVAQALSVRAGHTRSNVLAVSSTFADGRRLTTGANRQPKIFPPDPTTDAASFPWVRDPAAVCEAHRRRLDLAALADRPRVAPAGSDVAVLEREWAREHDWLLRCGYRWRDDAAGRYRPTWKGAFLSTWRLLEPIRGVRVRRRDRLARCQWADLGMDRWQPPAVPVAPLANAAARSSPEDGSPLRYEARLPEGSINYVRTGDTLAVRIGAPTVGRALARQWANLGTAALFGLLLAYLTFTLVGRWQIAAYVRPRDPLGFVWATSKPALVGAAFWAICLAFDLRSILRAVRRAGRPVEVVASPLGLRFEYAPGPAPRAGQIARDDLRGLHVNLFQVGFGGRRYQLTAHRAGHGTVVLARARAAAPLNELRDALAVAMGIVREPTVDAAESQSIRPD